MGELTSVVLLSWALLIVFIAAVVGWVLFIATARYWAESEAEMRKYRKRVIVQGVRLQDMRSTLRLLVKELREKREDDESPR